MPKNINKVFKVKDIKYQMEYVKFKNSEQTEFLRKVKNKSKKSWNKIAEAFNISQSSIIKYLSGKVKMPKNLFYKLCNQYKINSLQ